MIDCNPAPPSPWTAHYSNVYSQYGEDGLLAEIFRRVGTTNKQCFECGAADGKWFSNSRRLIDGGWSAALIEADPSNWPELDKLDNTATHANAREGVVNVVHGKAEPTGPNSLDSILAQCGFDTSPDLGVIDVDGQDWYLWNGMLKFQPRVMVVEYDPFAPSPGFLPDLGGAGQAGLSAICSIAVSKGYFNVCATQTNLIFCRNDLREKFHASLDGLAPTPAPEAVKARPAVSEERAAAVFEEPVVAKPAAGVPMLATGREQEIKIAAVLSRPRFGLNCFWDAAAEMLSPWGIPLQSFGGVFWGQCMAKAFEDNIAAGVDWIVCLDYDTLATSRHLQMLIDALGQNPHIDGISALQCRRGRPLPLAVREDGQMPITGGPVKVRTSHFGLTLLRTEAIKKVPKPWFWAQPAKDGSWGEGRLDDDIAWWASWGSAHNTLYVHTGCRIGHVEEIVSEFDADGKHHHTYLTAWRQANGFKTKAFD